MKNFIITISLGFLILLSSVVVEITPPTTSTLGDILEEVEVPNEEIDKDENSKEGSMVVEVSKEEKIKTLLKTEYDNNSQYEIAGVIYVEDFIFDIVMLPTVNDDYLYNTRDKKWNDGGELFLSDHSKFNEDNKSLDMTRIYGHRRGDGSKFGLITRLFDKNNQRPMYFYDGNETTKYNIARAFEFVDGTEKFEQYELDSVGKLALIDKLTANANVNYIEEIHPERDVVFLQTCQHPTGLMRFVVMFVEEGVV